MLFIVHIIVVTLKESASECHCVIGSFRALFGPKEPFFELFCYSFIPAVRQRIGQAY